MSMRIRILTLPPLSITKVWSSLANLPSAATVSDLKHLLCKQVPALKGLKSGQIQLFIDEFELLEALPIDIVHENDTVHVKRVDSCIPASVPRKRKRSPSSSSLSSTSSSSSSSSSKTSSSSSSGSESTTDSVSDSDPPPSKSKPVKPSERQTVNRRPPVPPGMGKPATHSRNIRRRKKFQHERNSALRDPDNPSAGVNAIPLGNHYRAETAESTTQAIVNDHGELAMGSLSNKNKKRGFKSAMGKEVPSKIVFSDQADSNSNVDLQVPASTTRMVPPSEKQEKGLLPPNLFVTSIDVEEGILQGKRSKYDAPNTERSETSPVSRSAGVVDRAAIESKWDSLGLVGGVTELPTGTIVGWKALGINPVTITPEVMLYVGAVVSCDENQVTVKFPDWTGARLAGDGDAEETEESHGWGDIVDQWRIITV